MENVKKPFITICTPVYNQEKFVEETLESVKAQTFTDFEVVIVDDGSKDNSRQVIEPYLADPRFIYVYQENAGVGAARNVAIARARGEWFCHLDGDDLFTPDALETFVRLAKSAPDLNFVYGNMEMFSPDGTKRTALTPDFFGSGDIRHLIYSKYGYPTASVMVRTEKLRQIGGYKTDLPLLEDYDMYLRYAHSGLNAASEDKVVALYRVLHGGKTSNLVRASKFAAEIAESVPETDPALRKCLRKAIGFHKSRYHLMSAIECGPENKKEFLRHVVRSIYYRPRRQKRAIIAAALTSIAMVSRTNKFDGLLRKLIYGAQEMPWAEESFGK